MTTKIPTTINTAELEKLPKAVIAGTHHLSKNMGSGCLMDPPGYPTYYIRHVYTKQGNAPHRGPESVISDRVISVAEWKEGETWESRSAAHKALMRRLYNPLPVDHPRVQAWARACSAYFGGGVIPPSGSRNVGDLYSYKLDVIKKGLDNGSLELEQCRVADYILEHYPDFPRDALYTLCTTRGSHGKYGEGSWWELLEAKPTPKECPGCFLGPHPCNTSWCQVCGWVED